VGGVDVGAGGSSVGVVVTWVRVGVCVEGREGRVGYCSGEVVEGLVDDPVDLGDVYCNRDRGGALVNSEHDQEEPSHTPVDKTQAPLPDAVADAAAAADNTASGPRQDHSYLRAHRPHVRADSPDQPQIPAGHFDHPAIHNNAPAARPPVFEARVPSAVEIRRRRRVGVRVEIVFRPLVGLGTVVLRRSHWHWCDHLFYLPNQMFYPIFAIRRPIPQFPPEEGYHLSYSSSAVVQCY